MTLDFAKELNREWPSLHLYVGEELIFHLENTSAFSIEHLLETYHAIETLTPNDPYLFSLLQQALSQEGKQAFQSAIEEGVFKLLGEKSHYFLPILSNSDITLIQKSPSNLLICYTFEQLIVKNGERQRQRTNEKHMVIAQPLIKGEEGWSSLKPEIRIGTKEKGGAS